MKKTLLFDFNNLAMRCCFIGPVQTIGNDGTPTFDMEMWRFLVFNSIYYAMLSIKNVEEIILAVDNSSWRKFIWPRYKANRAKARKEDKIDWNFVYSEINNYIKLIDEMLPFKVVQVKNAEADDVIGSLCLHNPKEYVIVSSDKDYLQLSNIAKIYNPLQKKYISTPDVDDFIINLCILGQKKDNIYNIRTPLDQNDDEKWVRCGPTFAEKIKKYGLQRWLEENNKVDHFNLNNRLINFKEIPETIKNRVLEKYNQCIMPGPDESYKFISSHGWTGLLENYHQVETNLLKLY